MTNISFNYNFIIIIKLFIILLLNSNQLGSREKGIKLESNVIKH